MSIHAADARTIAKHSGRRVAETDHCAYTIAARANGLEDDAAAYNATTRRRRRSLAARTTSVHHANGPRRAMLAASATWSSPMLAPMATASGTRAVAASELATQMPPTPKARATRSESATRARATSTRCANRSANQHKEHRRRLWFARAPPVSRGAAGQPAQLRALDRAHGPRGTPTVRTCLRAGASSVGDDPARPRTWPRDPSARRAASSARRQTPRGTRYAARGDDDDEGRRFGARTSASAGSQRRAGPATGSSRVVVTTALAPTTPVNARPTFEHGELHRRYSDDRRSRGVLSRGLDKAPRSRAAARTADVRARRIGPRVAQAARSARARTAP